MRNCYKREDVFLCRHDSHRGFDHRVSAYHVLVEKRCYPHGCLDFIWKCKLLGKGGTCPKGYKHVGSNCTSCRFYDEEKVQRRPVLLLSEDEYAAFLEDCRSFDDWVADKRDRLVEVGGRITDIRPHLVKEVDGSRSSMSLRGFLLRLESAYVGMQGLDDALYMRVSRAQQQRHRLAAGDGIEGVGLVDLDRGRLVVAQTRRLRVEERSGAQAPGWDRALLDRSGAVTLEGQPGRCLRCERGALVDVRDLRGRGRGAVRREVLCLEGIGRPEDCPYEALRALRAGVTLGEG
jgi:hypothetical protein